MLSFLSRVKGEGSPPGDKRYCFGIEFVTQSLAQGTPSNFQIKTDSAKAQGQKVGESAHQMGTSFYPVSAQLNLAVNIVHSSKRNRILFTYRELVLFSFIWYLIGEYVPVFYVLKIISFSIIIRGTVRHRGAL